MIHFMLNDLSRPTAEVFRACLHLQGLILYLDGLISLAFAGTAEQRQTPLFGIVRLILFQDDRVEHHGVRGLPSAFIKKGDDAFPNSDHICCHSNARLPVSHQGLKEIIGNGDMIFRRILGFTREEYRVVHKFSNHRSHPQMIDK